MRKVIGMTEDDVDKLLAESDRRSKQNDKEFDEAIKALKEGL